MSFVAISRSRMTFIFSFRENPFAVSHHEPAARIDIFARTDFLQPLREFAHFLRKTIPAHLSA